MPDYSRLLLSTGGGIISAAQKAAQRENTATILIGCGGTGKDALRQIKKSLYARVKEDPNSPNGFPKYNHIRFLSIDTDGDNIGEFDRNAEFFDISVENPAQLAEDLAKRHIPGFEWMSNAKVQEGAQSGTGAGGNRQAGRMMLLKKNEMGQLTDKILGAINEASTGDEIENIQILIYTGLGGGTGSGIFLDVCYLIQHILKLNNITASTQLFAFLPDVNLSKSELEPATREFVSANGYAAMRELDYCMNLGKGRYWRLELGGSVHRNFDTPPANLVTLLSAQTAGVALKDNGYEYAMNVAAEFSLDLICSSSGAAGGIQEFSFASFLINYQSMLGYVESNSKHGANYNYCVMGSAVVEMPFRKILTYLASKLFQNKFSGISQNRPTKQDYNTFIQAVGLNLGHGNADPPLFKAMCRGEDSHPYKIPEYGMYADEFHNGANRPLIKAVDDALQNRYSVWKANITSLTGDLAEKSYTWDSKPSEDAPSIINRIYAQLIKEIIDVNKGPYYAKALLEGADAWSLSSALNALTEWSTGKAATVAYNTVSDEKLNQAHEAFKRSPGGVHFHKKYDVYAALVVHRYEDIDDLGYTVDDEFLQMHFPGRQLQFREMVEKIKEQVKALAGQLKILCDMLDALQAVFASNYRDLTTSGANLDFVDGTYVQELFEVQDLQGNMDETIEGMEGGGLQFSGLMQALLNMHRDWSNDKKIVGAVSAYLTDLFTDYSNRSLDDYLRLKYDPDDSGVGLTQIIANEVYQKLKRNAQPLFWGELNATGRFAYVTAPTISTTCVNAAQLIAESDLGYQVRMSGQTDRIKVQVFVGGVAMNQYVPEGTYRAAYFRKNENNRKGLHLNESEVENWNVLLPYLESASELLSHVTDVNVGSPDVSAAKIYQEVYESARRCHILTIGKADGGLDGDKSVYLHYVDYEKLNAAINEQKRKWNSNETTAREISGEGGFLALANAALEAQKSLIDDRDQFILPQIADSENPANPKLSSFSVMCLAGYEEDVRLDNFVRLRGFRERTEAELEKFKKYEQDLKDFEAEITKADDEATVRNLFQKALFTGLFQFVEDDIYQEITYTVIDDTGMEDEPIELSGPLEDDYKFNAVGIYQAYVNFCDYAEIHENAKERANAIVKNTKKYRESLNWLWNHALSTKAANGYTRAVNAKVNSHKWTKPEGEKAKEFINQLYTDLSAEMENKGAKKASDAYADKPKANAQDTIKATATTSNTKFYVAVNKETTGPYTIEQLQEMVEQGQFDEDKKVFVRGWKEWKKAGEVEELASLFLPPIPDDDFPPIPDDDDFPPIPED